MNHQYTYLRLSVTDRCNFNCFYCRPSARIHFFKKDEALRFDETLELAGKLADFGIRHIRLTGGEPCLRPDLSDLAHSLSSLPGVDILSLTSNGFKLGESLKDLKKNGVSRINISLDTLRRDKFKKISGLDGFAKVRDAVLKASVLGFSQVKLNVVVMRHVNDDEILDFVDFGAKNRIDVRFIEYFPVNGSCDAAKGFFVPTDEVKKKIRATFGDMVFLGNQEFSGPAQYYQIDGASNRVGFISSVSDFFCPGCNRLRLSADGRLYPCLHSDHHVDLRKALRDGGNELSGLIARVAENKKLFNKAFCSRRIEMSEIGG